MIDLTKLSMDGALELPDNAEIKEAIKYVKHGEYETYLYAESLRILDVGANSGGERIVCYRFPGDIRAVENSKVEENFIEEEKPNLSNTISCITPQELGSFDIIKVDVEGSENDIVYLFDLTDVSLFQIEVHQEKWIQDYIEYFISKGFVVRDLIPYNDEEGCAFINFYKDAGIFKDTRI